MKKGRKWMALLLVCCLLASLAAGCKKSDDAAGTGNGNVEDANSGNNGGGGDATDGDTAGGDTGEDVDALPLTDEKKTLSIWCSIDTTTANNLTDYSETPASKELEERTNVHIDYQHPSSTATQEQFNMLIASDNLPDIMWYNSNSAYYSGGLDAMIEDGYFLELSDLAAKYMPNYMDAIHRNDETTRQCYTDAGNMAVAWMLNIEKEWDWGGPLVRKDWLEQLNMEVPKTYDDWTEMLRGFKNEMGASTPLLVQSKTFFTMLESLNSGYGVTDAFHNEDGTVVYDPITDNYKDFIKLMASWYQEGLIDVDFMTRDTADMTPLATGQAGALQMGVWVQPTVYKSLYDVEMVPAPYPSKDGSTTHLGWQQYEICSDAVGITTSCSDPELAAKWINYLFSEEGTILRNYGVEGVSFEYIDGKPEFNEEVREKKGSGNYSSYDWIGICNGVGIYDWQNSLYGNAEENLVCYDVWDASTDGAWTMPPSTLTAEEGNEYSVIIGDIQTYVEENTIKFITGALDIDSEWDGYVNTIKGMNIDRAIELQQAALDRYYAR